MTITQSNTKSPASVKRVTAHALTHYFENLADEFTGTPPLRRIPAEKLRNDILFRLLTETYDVVGTMIPDKRVFNGVFRKTFRDLLEKSWNNFPKRG